MIPALRRQIAALCAFIMTAFVLFPGVTRAETVTYRVDGTMYEHRIIATIDGRDYIAFTPEVGISTEVAQGDFDGDGHTDLLHGWSSGGNCCPTSFQVLSYRGNGIFTNAEHDDFWTWGEPDVTTDAGRTLFRVESQRAGVGRTEDEVQLTRFAFRDGKLEIVEQGVSTARMAAVLDIFATDFDDRGLPKDRPMVVRFDMNDDGTMDALQCRWWERWGAILCDVQITGGALVQNSNGCARIGVLETSTNGLRDLVCGNDGVLVFNGANYAVP